MYILLRNNQHHQKKYPSGKVREAVARYQNDTKSKNIRLDFENLASVVESLST